MATTRKQIRRDVLDGIGDLVVLTATEDSSSNVEFIDRLHLTGEPGAYASRMVLFTDGTEANMGEYRTITGNSSARRAIGFGESLPSIPQEGDECEMINMRGTGYTFQAIHQAINRVIRGVKHVALVPAGTDEVVFARGDDLVVPANFRTIEGVQWLDEDDPAIWRSLPYSKRWGGSGYWVDSPSRTVSVGGPSSYKIDGRTVRVWGLTEPDELYSDDESTDLDTSWLVPAVQEDILAAKFLRMTTPETERAMMSKMQRAAAFRSTTIARRSPFSVELA